MQHEPFHDAAPQTGGENDAQYTGVEAKPVFPVVGIGASAGGLRALQQFFEAMPPTSGMAFVVILHLSPEHESHAAQILQQSTSMPVTQVTEPVHVEPNHVYIIPPTRSLAMEDGQIVLQTPERPRGQHVAIDLFFRTLAETHTTHAACIVLSGMGADGSVGIKRLKETGGLAIAQEPHDAEYDGMPRNAITTGLIDWVLPVADMPQRLLAWWQNASQIALPPEADTPVVAEHWVAENALRDVLAIVRTRTGHDFTHYKRATILRRIERRMQVVTVPTLPAYRDYLREHGQEASLLLQDLLIGVTNFFRDRAAFDTLEREVVPLLFEGKTMGDVLRVWVAGCASGEEAYSVAMLLFEHAARVPHPPAIQVFATDIDETAIATARDGSYPESIATDVSPERLHTFFTKEAGGYRINNEVRERVLFATHNLIKDPPFSKVDLLTCRNLLIYLNRDVQEQVFPLFHFALRANGFLFLGSSESLNGASDLFAPISTKHRVFRANPLGRSARVVPALPLEAPVVRPRPRTDTGAERRRIAFGELHQRMLEQYAPPSIIVNADNEIVHLSEHAGRFIQLGGGEPSLNVLQVVLPPLRLELRTALFQAFSSGKGTEARRVRLEHDGRISYVNMIVRPEHDPATDADFALVLFAEVDEILGTEGKTGDDSISEPVVRRLEEENERLKAQLQTTIEQYETGVEELKASNEELQAINEELRSAGEELETSKEELQSVNEELRTVNEELKHKVDEVSAANDDLSNLMSSTDIATVFLDRSLRVKRYTPRARDVFSLIPLDEGRSLADITHKLEYDSMLEDANAVLRTLQPVEREVASRDGHFLIARMVPYRTTEDRIDGVVLTFVDLSARKQAEHDLRESLERTTEVLESISDAFYAVDADFRFTYINQKTEELWGRGRESLIGKHYWTEFPAAVGSESYQKHLEAMRERRVIHYETVSPLIKGWIDVSIYPDTRGGLSVYFRDITERKRAEEQLRRAAELDAFRVELNDALRSLNDPLAIQAEAVRVLGLRLHTDSAHYTEIDEAQGVYRVQREFVRGDAPSIIGTHPMAAFSWLGPQFLAGGRIVIPDVETSPLIPDAQRAAVATINVGALVSVPLIKNERLVAALSITSLSPRKWTPEEVELVSETAERTWAAIERARAEEALRASEERLRLLVESAHDYAIFTTTPERIVDSWSSGAARIFGYEEAEIVGQSGDILFTPEDREQNAPVQEAATALATGRAADERWHIRKDGSRFYASGVTMPLKAGDVRGFVTIARDLTEQQRAQEALRASEEKYRSRAAELRAVLESMSDGVYIGGMEGIILANQPALDQLGFTSHEELDRHIGTLAQEIQTRDVETGAMIPVEEQAFARALAGERVVQEVRVRHRLTGEDRVVRCAASPVIIEGRVIAAVAVNTDITERRRVEEALRASEERLRLATETGHIGTCDWNYQTGEMRWNAERFRMYGLEPQDRLMRIAEFYAIVHPHDRKRVRREIHEGIGERGVHAEEYRIVRPDGTVRWIVEAGRVVEWQSKEPLRIISVLFDVTERREAEDRLRASEERARTLIRNLPGGAAFIFDHDLRYVLADGEALRAVGRTPADYEGKTIAEVLPPELVGELEPALRGALAGESFELERGQGERAFVSRGVPLRDGSGDVAGVLVVSYDITERKRAEEAVRESEARFRNMADHAPVMVWVTDADATCTYLSQSWYEFTGQTPEIALGLGWLQATHPDDRAQTEQIFLAANNRREPFRLEYRLRRHDGSYGWAIDSAQPRFGTNNEFLGYIGSVIDITERKQAEQERERLLQAEQAARAEAEAALGIRDQFLSIASHELRTPLTSLMGYTGMLPRMVARGSTDTQKTIDRIMRQAQRLNSLIDQLLDVSRLQRGQFAIERQPVDLAALVTHMVDEVGATTLSPTTKHSVELIRPAEPVMVDGDAQRLEQVVANLLSNAIKYSPNGGPVRVHVAHTGTNALVTVTDQGIGIPEEAQARLFEPFYRAPNVGGQASGFGLGLHIVREIVQRHGGRITVHSTTNEGSTFEVTLPLQRAGSSPA